jgi:quercetin dioxygenase-like cupin family protein
MVKLPLGFLALSLTASVGLAAEMTVMTPDATKWGPAPSVFAKGMEFAVIYGDPYASGEYVVREKLPAGYAFPAHFHPGTENFTVISGTFHIGMGDKLDKKHAQTLEAGAFLSMPAKMHHYAWASSDTVIQLHGVGPLALTYVNPADDPRLEQPHDNR